MIMIQDICYSKDGYGKCIRCVIGSYPKILRFKDKLETDRWESKDL